MSDIFIVLMDKQYIEFPLLLLSLCWLFRKSFCSFITVVNVGVWVLVSESNPTASTGLDRPSQWSSQGIHGNYHRIWTLCLVHDDILLSQWHACPNALFSSTGGSVPGLCVAFLSVLSFFLSFLRESWVWVRLRALIQVWRTSDQVCVCAVNVFVLLQRLYSVVWRFTPIFHTCHIFIWDMAVSVCIRCQRHGCIFFRCICTVCVKFSAQS